MYSLEEIVVNNTDEIENRLRLLHKIVSQKSFDLNEHINQALEQTTKLLGMEIGILSRISDGSYTITHHYSKNGGLENGQTFTLGQTYCSITIEENKAVAINHMQKSPHSRHPCYEHFQLESYIGIPIFIDDELYGTLNFSSPSPKAGEFVEADKTLIKLLAEWTSSVLRRKRVKDALVEREKLYKLVSTNSNDLICLHDPDGTFRFVSPSSENIIGYKPEELIGKNPSIFHHPDDLQRIQDESHIHALNNKAIKSVQYRFKKKNGEYIWLDTATQPVTNVDGEVVNLQSTSRDITDRKKLEILFAQAEKMAKVGGWEFDLKSGDLFWTDEVYRIHEKPVGEKVKVDEGVTYFPGEAQTRIQDAIEYTIETGHMYDVVLPFVTAMGNHKWVRAIGQAQFNDGQAYMLRGTFQDITQQKKIEEKIKKKNKELKELTNTRDKLYSIIGHDLKNSFFGLFVLIEMVEEMLKDEIELSDSLKDKLKLLDSTTSHSYQLLENLLEWINLQRGNFSLNQRSIDVTSLVEECITVYKLNQQNKEIDIQTDISNCPPLFCDAEMIKTVVRNLVSNAIKYSPNQSVIKVSAFGENENVVVKVKDNGIGMPDRIQAKLFDPAERPKRAGTKQEKGTGLGLLLCKEFVDLHNGTIEVDSVEGEGTTFTVTIPATSEDN